MLEAISLTERCVWMVSSWSKHQSSSSRVSRASCWYVSSVLQTYKKRYTTLLTHIKTMLYLHAKSSSIRTLDFFPGHFLSVWLKVYRMFSFCSAELFQIRNVIMISKSDSWENILTIIIWNCNTYLASSNKLAYFHILTKTISQQRRPGTWDYSLYTGCCIQVSGTHSILWFLWLVFKEQQWALDYC